jgi:dodecin
MSGHNYGMIELVDDSAESMEAAIENAIQTAKTSLRHVDQVEVASARDFIVEGKVAHYQVELKVGFRVDS